MLKKAVKIFLLLFILCGSVYLALYGIGKNNYGSGKEIKKGLDLNGGLSITFEATEKSPSTQDMEDTKDVLSKRVLTYSTEASVYQEGENRINVEIPLKSTDMESAKNILDDLGTPGTLEFKDPDGNVVLTGADVSDAKAGTIESETGGKDYVVTFKLSKEGQKKFSQATLDVSQRTDGKNYIEISFDGEIISAPRCSNQINSDSVQVENMDSYKEADKLAVYIRSGSMPLELKTIRSSILAAQLGSDAISTSLKAGLIGILIVMIFMLLVYRLPGLVADISLAIYVSLTLFVISAFEVTLTLPGIAGVILSIGMAVDANVIIFARIKEEIGAGSSVGTAINNGFNKAFSAIFDGNITTLIAAAVLYMLGSGTIKGFASTLAIGIILSMFTALVISKFIIKLFYELGAKNEVLYGAVGERKVIDFVGKRKVFFVLSFILIIVGPIMMIVNSSKDKGAFNYSIEFAGGSSTTITFNESYSQSEIESKIVPIIQEQIGNTNVQVQRVEGTNEVVFKTRELTAEESEKISKALKSSYNIDESKVVSDNISSSVSSEMRRDAIIAIVVSTICMLLYIWIRFRNIKFATSAIFAIVHDVLVVIAFYALSRISVGNTFIACSLTIVGYTINATIVIFDRIRENLKEMSKPSLLEHAINKSITETLTRSINTSFTTFVMVFMIFILGVTSIKEFALPLMVGVIVGGYSSVCITGSLLYMFLKKKNG